MTPRFAWPTYKEQWDCQVSGFVLDGQDASDNIDSDYLRLNGSEKNWNTGLLHDQVTSELACPDGRAERMSLCPGPIPVSSGTTSSVLPATATTV